MSEVEIFAELASMVEVDPFSLLGISVSADEKRIARRYRTVAKQLHPDVLSSKTARGGLTPDSAAQVIARIVNPSYQKLKHENSRQETISTLRFRVRRLVRTEKLVPTFPHAQQLAQTSDDTVDIFYEQALTHLAATQFRTIEQMYTHSLEIGQLNLVYLRRKMSDLVIRPKRAGLITQAVTPTSVNNTIGSVGPVTAGQPDVTVGQVANGEAALPAASTPPDYVAKHTSRAKTYLQKGNYEQAVNELREAIKLSPKSPEIHSMLGQAYFKQKLSGMSKAHFRQALKLNPQHKVAQKYAKLLGLEEEIAADKNTAAVIDSRQQKNTNDESKRGESEHDKSEKTPQRGAWLGRLLKR